MADRPEINLPSLFRQEHELARCHVEQIQRGFRQDTTERSAIGGGGFGKDMKGMTIEQGTEQMLYGNVEDKLCQHAFPDRGPQRLVDRLLQPPDQVYHRPLFHHHALGLPGRSGGVEDIGRIRSGCRIGRAFSGCFHA